MLTTVQEKWSSLNNSEQRTIKISSVILCAIMYYALCISPLLEEKKRLDNRVTIEKSLYLSTKKKVTHILSTGIRLNSENNMSIAASLDHYSQKNQLSIVTKRAESENTWIVGFNETSFTQFINFLTDIERNGFEILSFSVRKHGNKTSIVVVSDLRISKR